MFLFDEVLKKSKKNKSVKVGLIGAGKFGSMFLSQVPTTPALSVTSIADINPTKAKQSCRDVGWSDEYIEETQFFDNAIDMIEKSKVDVIVEATGDPVSGVIHAKLGIANHIHIIMVNVEADVLAGYQLSKEAMSNGVVYSMAYGDQPSLICELVDWARCSGFDVVAAGKGTKFLPSYVKSTPETVWDHYGISKAQAVTNGMNSQMFNSFLDGTKSALEMAAVSNATGLTVPSNGLSFPPVGVDDLANILKPISNGGLLETKGQVEVVSSLELDGRPVSRDLRWGVYVVVEANNDYSAGCFRQYGMNTDTTGYYSAMYKPFHLIGLELNNSIFSAVLLGKATGSTKYFNADVIAVSKTDLKKGQMLDGEGGSTVWGKLFSSDKSMNFGGLPIGLTNQVRLVNDVSVDTPLCWTDIEINFSCPVVKLRKHMEKNWLRQFA